MGASVSPIKVKVRRSVRIEKKSKRLVSGSIWLLSCIWKPKWEIGYRMELLWSYGAIISTPQGDLISIFSHLSLYLLLSTLGEASLGVWILLRGLRYDDYWVINWLVTHIGVAAPSLDIRVSYFGSGYGVYSSELCTVSATGHYALWTVCTALQSCQIATVLLYWRCAGVW